LVTLKTLSKGWYKIIRSIEDKKWYVVHTYSGYENKVKANLEQRVKSMGMENQIFSVLIPTERILETKSGKKRYVQKKSLSRLCGSIDEVK